MKTRFERLTELKLMSPQELDAAFVGALGGSPVIPTFMVNETQLWARHLAILNMESAKGFIHKYDFLCRSCARPCDSQDIQAGPAFAAYAMFSDHLLCIPCARALLNWSGVKGPLAVLIDQALSAGVLPSK